MPQNRESVKEMQDLEFMNPKTVTHVGLNSSSELDTEQGKGMQD